MQHMRRPFSGYGPVRSCTPMWQVLTLSVVAQVWKDVRADPEKGVGPTGEPCGIRTDSALPRTAKQILDEDLPGMGQFYCEIPPCAPCACPTLNPQP
jgi:hypothetical protein